MGVVMTLTPDPELIPAVRGMTGRLAEHLGFGEGAQRNLTEGLACACRQVMRKAGEEREEVRLQFAGYEDRVEISLEDGHDAGPDEMNEPDACLLTQLLDRVVFDQTAEGKMRLTLVHYLAATEGRP
jgi:hypothetical protein